MALLMPSIVAIAGPASASADLPTPVATRTAAVPTPTTNSAPARGSAPSATTKTSASPAPTKPAVVHKRPKAAPKKPKVHVTPPAKRPHPHGTPAPKRPHPKRAAWPVTLTIRTVPPSPGIRLRFDGQSLVTSARGLASVTIEHDLAGHSLTLADVTRNTSTSRMSFVRWSGQRDPNQVRSPHVVGLPMRANYTVVAAFATSYPVAVRLVERNGKQLDNQKAATASVTGRSDIGELIPFSTTQPTWVPGERPVLLSTGLAPQKISYSIQSVVVDGSNVVDTGKQTFEPTSAATAVIQTDFFDLTVATHDAMLGAAKPKKATLIYPNGTQVAIDFRHGSPVVIIGLPRGHYKIKLDVGSGIAATADFNLSRDRTQDVAIISLRDVIVVAAAVLILAILLIGFGRARWSSRLRRRSSREPSIDPPAYIDEEHESRIPA
jgi:hypothetical protein